MDLAKITIVSLSASVAFVALVTGCTLVMQQNNENDTKVTTQFNESCLGNGGSIMVDNNGRRQCIKFAK